MFRKIQNLFKSCQNRLRPHFSERGQVAIVLVLVIAIALIVYSISLNWGRVAQYKTMTTVASNTTAAYLASAIASHGEHYLQTILGGRVEYCKRTNFLVLLVTFIAAVVITWACWGTCIAGTTAMVLAVVGVVLAGLALVIHVTVVEPGLTRMWNRAMSEMKLEDQIIEGAIMTGIQGIVSDQSRISDHFDMDADGLWVDQFDASNSVSHKDRISRFAFYYTKRLHGFTPTTVPEIQGFVNGLAEFLREGGDGYGIFDPACTVGSKLPTPYCNACCQPQFEPDGVTPLRPEDCTLSDIVLCSISGDYPRTSYAYQYEPSREVFTNAFYSFRERLGVDDENIYFNRNPLNPNSPPPQILAVNPNIQFRIEDTTGFYSALDNRRGVFPFFWTMSALLPALPVTAVPPPIIPQIPKSDDVEMMVNFLTLPNQCSSVVGYDPGTGRPRTDGFYWKPGSDQYCSDTYPYNDCINWVGNCQDGVFNPVGPLPSCGCEASSDATLWHDDSLDNLVNGLKEFSLWAENFLTSPISDLNRNFVQWYPKFAFWFAPRCPAAAQCNNPTPADPVTCRYCNNENNDGAFLVWRDMLGAWVDLLDNWLYRTSFADPTAYCLPPFANYMPWAERSSMPSQQTGTPIPQDRFGVNMPPIWGDLNDTIACLQYNQNNYQKVQTCQTACLRDCRPPAVCDHNGNADACLNLPRSVFNIYNINAQYNLAQRYQDCLSSTCVDSFGVILPVCSWIAGANCAGWPGNAFNTSVRNLRNAAIDASDICEPGATAATTPFQDAIVLAKAEAWAQQPHLRDRLPILTNVRTRALPTRQVFLDGYNHMNTFLTPCAAGLALGEGCGNCAAGGPVAQLICARRAYDPQTTNALSNFVIYGWQGKPISGRGPLGTDPDKGYWHLVRVEAFAPQRCYNQCITNELPTVKTRTSGGFFNRKRCYFLANRRGRVIARVTRYDEDRDSPGARFANFQMIWKFRFTNPGVLSTAIPANVLSTDCMHPAAYDVGVSPNTKVELDSAFMINKRSDVPASCWNRVNDLLDRGIKTSTCAEYDYDGAINHMNMKFVPCQASWVDTATTCALWGGCP